MKRIAYTMSDDSEYFPLPSRVMRDAYMLLHAAGAPFDLVVDDKPYRFKVSPQFSVPERLTLMSDSQRVGARATIAVRRHVPAYSCAPRRNLSP